MNEGSWIALLLCDSQASNTIPPPIRKVTRDVESQSPTRVGEYELGTNVGTNVVQNDQWVVLFGESESNQGGIGNDTDTESHSRRGESNQGW